MLILAIQNQNDLQRVIIHDDSKIKNRKIINKLNMCAEFYYLLNNIAQNFLLAE